MVKLNLEWKKKFLKGRLGEAHKNLELNRDDEGGRKYFEYEIKTLKSWIKELENPHAKAKDKRFTEWKIDFLQNHINALRMMHDEDEYLGDEEKEDIKQEMATIDRYIQEIKTGEI